MEQDRRMHAMNNVLLLTAVLAAASVRAGERGGEITNYEKDNR